MSGRGARPRRPAPGRCGPGGPGVPGDVPRSPAAVAPCRRGVAPRSGAPAGSVAGTGAAAGDPVPRAEVLDRRGGRSADTVGAVAGGGPGRRGRRARRRVGRQPAARRPRGPDRGGDRRAGRHRGRRHRARAGLHRARGVGGRGSRRRRRAGRPRRRRPGEPEPRPGAHGPAGRRRGAPPCRAARAVRDPLAVTRMVRDPRVGTGCADRGGRGTVARTAGRTARAGRPLVRGLRRAHRRPRPLAPSPAAPARPFACSRSRRPSSTTVAAR